MNQKLRQKVLERDNYTCQICLKTLKSLDVNHIIPKRLDGLDSLYNLFAVCRKCHCIIELDPPSKGMKNIKMIKVKDKTHTELNSVGERGETFDEIIQRLLDFYNKRE